MAFTCGMCARWSSGADLHAAFRDDNVLMMAGTYEDHEPPSIIQQYSMKMNWGPIFLFVVAHMGIGLFEYRVARPQE